MAIIPVHTIRAPSESLQKILDKRPSTWVDDGLSFFPDSIFGWSIKAAGSGHDAYYCGRMWPAGAMDEEHKRKADKLLRQWVWELLPFGLRMVGYLVFLGVWRGGYGAYNSCGRNPRGATAGQLAQGLCRHGAPKPEWMTRLWLVE